jgi:hypothetical protein
MKGPTFKKTNEPPKRGNDKGNIKFPNPLLYSKKHTKSFNVTFKTMVENGHAGKATNNLL